MLENSPANIDGEVLFPYHEAMLKPTDQGEKEAALRREPNRPSGVFGRAAGVLAALLCQPRCRSCRAPLFNRHNPYLCESCLDAIPWIREGACRICGYPAGPHAVHRHPCRRCAGNRLALTAGASVARYRNGARSLVLALKFGGETELVRPLAGLMGQRLEDMEWSGHIDALIPVPLHPARLRLRGFDQARLLGALIAGWKGIPLLAGSLRRKIHTQPQALLRREQRLSNVNGAFSASGSLSGKSILLVDDVMTTGATMAACARACRQAGARRVYALTFAR